MMTRWERNRAVDRIEDLVETVETELMPVPVREIWVFGDLALGLDPVERFEVYLTKDVLLRDEQDGSTPAEFHGLEGIGKSIRSAWAEQFPEYVRANSGGHVAPERCLAAQLLDDDPIHLEVCNASFEDNVTQRLEGAIATGSYEEILDPRGVCLWIDGHRSDEAFDKLRGGEYVFPTLAGSLEMLGVTATEAEEAAETLTAYRENQHGQTVRKDVV